MAQASSASVGRERFETLFGTPQGVDVAAVARGFGHRVAEVDSITGLRNAVQAGLLRAGLDVVVIRTDRVANVEGHDLLNAAVIAAVRRAWGLAAAG